MSVLEFPAQSSHTALPRVHGDHLGSGATAFGELDGEESRARTDVENPEVRRSGSK
jgi:hypothetical protein